MRAACAKVRREKPLFSAQLTALALKSLELRHEGHKSKQRA